MNELILSDSEKEIMEWMWKENKECSYREFFAEFGEGAKKGWKKQTLSTFLTRMEKKGVITIRKEGNKYYYRAALNEQQYERKRAKYVLDEYFNGSLNQFMIALNGGESLNEDEANELRKYLEG